MSPLIILDRGKDVGRVVTVTVIGAFKPTPVLNACFVESTAYMALSRTERRGKGALRPGATPQTSPMDSRDLPTHSIRIAT